MNRLPKVVVWFTIAGIFNMNDLYKKMDIVDAKLRDINDWPKIIKNKKNLPIELQPRYEWSVEMIEENCFDIKKPLVKLMDLLSDKIDIIRSMENSENMRKCFTIIIYESEILPEISLNRDIINFLQSINSEICFDIER